MNALQHKPRLIIIFFTFVSLYLFLAVNLYRIQIQNYDFFNERAKKQYGMTMTVTPPRAEIVDRTGSQPLALNIQAIAGFIVPKKIKHPDILIPFLQENFKEAAERLKKQPKNHFMFIKRRLTPEEIELIEQHDISDIKFLKEPSRYYPVAGVGPIVGITDIDNQGLFGIEKICNTTLAGTPTTYELEKDCRSKRFYITRETKVKGTHGKPVMLTLDSLLQFLVYDELKDHVEQMGSKTGSVLICNPENGDILVMANYPDFNPNTPELITQERTKNRIITDAYELGSIIKVFLALAAIEENVVTADEIIDCENKTHSRINGMPISTIKANGRIPFEDVIRFSNNIGVAKVAHRLGPKLYDHYLRLGFSKKLGIFPGETPGRITHPSKWSKSSLTSLSFGYEISANLVQVAQALSIIANDGYLVPLHLLPANSKPIGPLYSEQAITQTKDILRKTVAQGASRKARINGYTVMGKTGTARLITNGRYDPRRHIFSFMAIVEKGSYKRVIVVSMKETTKKGYLASRVAVPLFERVAHKMLIHDKII